MKAVILAAGKGTRMKHLSAYLPKPMLTVKGKPILAWVIEGLGGAGISEYCIITGYLAEPIEKSFGDGRQRGIHIEYRRQPEPEGTARAAELARAFVRDDPFVLTYGDILTAPEHYQALCATFEREKPDGAIGVRNGGDLSKGGAALFDANFSLVNIVEKPTGHAPVGAWFNTGVYALTPTIFQFTPHIAKSLRGEYELTDALVAMVNAGHRIKGVEFAGYWADIGSPEALKQAEQMITPAV